MLTRMKFPSTLARNNSGPDIPARNLRAALKHFEVGLMRPLPFPKLGLVIRPESVEGFNLWFFLSLLLSWVSIRLLRESV